MKSIWRYTASRSRRTLFHIQKRSDAKVDVIDGFVTSNGQVMGTYIHGILDNDGLRRSILNALRTKKRIRAIRYCIPLL